MTDVIVDREDHGLPPPRRAGVNRVLGATSGSETGNTRAVLAVGAMLFLHALFTVLLLAYFRGAATDLKDFVLTMGTTIMTLDTTAVSYYFGKRAGDGA